MKNIGSTILNKKSCIAKIAALVLLFFGANVFLSYATDSYWPFTNGFHEPALDMVRRNGRPIIGLIYELHHLSGLSNISFYYISSALALVFLGLAIWVYQSILERYGIKENTRILLAFTAIANIYIIEYFMFIEKCGFMLAILFDIVGVYWIEAFFSEKKKSAFFLAVVSIILAIFTYQGTIALFVILSIPFAMKNADSFKRYALNGISIGIAYIIPVISDLLAFKYIFKSSRLEEETDYASTIRTVIYGLLGTSRGTFDILPWCLFLALTFVILAAAVIWVISCRKKLWRIFNIFIIILSACVFPTATILQGSGWWETRIVYPIASVAAALAIDMFVNGEETTVNAFIKATVRRASVMALVVLMVFQYFSFNRIYIDKYQLNALDEYRYQYIYQAICEYEESSGTQVTKVAFYSDADRTYGQYPHLYCTGDLVASAFVQSWSDVTAMNYYLTSNYEKVDQVVKYSAYFSHKNWNCLSKDQLIFDGDTLHICVY